MAAATATAATEHKADESGEGDVSSSEPCRGSEEIDLEMGKPEKECRICQMKLAGGSPELGLPFELGCSCKGDLAAAHKECAETWFRIRGNRTCEICGSAARNVTAAETAGNGNESSGESQPAAAAERGSWWRGHRLVNFLLACVVLSFIISWLFHFNVPG